MLVWSWCLWESTPFCLAWWLEKALLPVIIATAVAAFAIRQLKKKRSFDYASEQLARFYAPMLGKLSELKAHRDFDETLKRANEEAHSGLLERDRDRPVTSEYVKEAQAVTEQVRRFFEDILPRRFTHRVDLYVAMRTHFTDNLAYADEDTCLEFYNVVYEEVAKMQVYRDTPEEDFLPDGRAILGSKVDMAKLDVFQKHVHLRVEALKREIKG